MPQAIPVIASYVSAALATYGASAAVAYAAYTVTYYAVSALLLNLAVSVLTPRSKTGETKGMEVSLVDSTADARVIYGEVRVGGINMIPPYTSGTNGRYLHQVIALAAHEIDSFQAYYVDQDTLPAPAAVSGGSGDGAISSGTYSGKIWARGYTGTLTQNVDFILNAAFSVEWPSTCRARGFAYLAMQYDWGDGKTWHGLPQPTVLVRGAKVYDPRLDSTNGGSGSHRARHLTRK